MSIACLRMTDPDSSAVPPIEAPPVLAAPEPSSNTKKKGLLGALSVIGLLLLKFGKIILASFKFLKLGALLQTGGSMLVTAWFYSVALGWPFAVGLVVTILIHELGHVIAAWAYRVPVSAPMFIPGMGALIWRKHPAPTVAAEAVIAIAGPIAGALSGVFCWVVYAVTGSPLFLGLAHITFLINLFNMIPVFPMDGGRVLGAVSKWFLIPGMVMLAALFFTGAVRNPFLLVLLILALPRVFTSFKGGDLYAASNQATSAQKAVIAMSWVVVTSTLAWAMSVTDTHVGGRTSRPAGTATRDLAH